MGPHSGTAVGPVLRSLGLKVRMLGILDRPVSQGDIQVWPRRSATARRAIKVSEPICRDNCLNSLVDSYVTGPSILCGVGPIVILRVNHIGLSQKMLAGA